MLPAIPCSRVHLCQIFSIALLDEVVEAGQSVGEAQAQGWLENHRSDANVPEPVGPDFDLQRYSDTYARVRMSMWGVLSRQESFIHEDGEQSIKEALLLEMRDAAITSAASSYAIDVVCDLAMQSQLGLQREVSTLMSTLTRLHLCLCLYLYLYLYL